VGLRSLLVMLGCLLVHLLRHKGLLAVSGNDRSNVSSRSKFR
jgi:hypothetical protein